MDRCPKCGHWMLTYEPSRQAWVCFCQHCVPITCPCTCVIPESIESWRNRLLQQNRLGIHSVGPP